MHDRDGLHPVAGGDLMQVKRGAISIVPQEFVMLDANDYPQARSARLSQPVCFQADRTFRYHRKYYDSLSLEVKLAVKRTRAERCF